ncbi:MAG: SsgA family sporulation/cell division regulator [Cellulomonas sp.]
MNHDRYDLTTLIHAHLILSDATTTDTEIELGFRASDPYVIDSDFTADGPTATWLLARELVMLGLVATQESPAGEGDVQVWRDEDPGYLLVSLTGTSGIALLAVPARQVQEFLDETRALVPIGTESSRVSAALDDFVAMLLTM